jgi:hypothetical protein
MIFPRVEFVRCIVKCYNLVEVTPLSLLAVNIK